MVRKAVVLLVLGLAVAAVGCGRQQVTVDAEDHSLSAAAEHTGQAHTAKVHMTVVTTSSDSAGASGTPRTFTTTGEGAYDTESGLASLTSTIVPTSSSDPSGSAASPALAMPGMADAKQETIWHGHVVYMRVPSTLMGTATDPNKWLKFDFDSPFGGSGGSSSALSQMSPMTDPSAMLGYLKSIGAGVATVGHETIDGVDTTHVHATFSFAQAIAAADPNGGGSQGTVPDGLGALASSPIPIDVYIDRDQYVRRIVITEDSGRGSFSSDPDTSSGQTTGTQSVTTTFDYRDFGLPVSITQPSPADTMSICDMFDQVKNSLSGVVTDTTTRLPGC